MLQSDINTNVAFFLKLLEMIEAHGKLEIHHLREILYSFYVCQITPTHRWV